ncbi:MAG TPA: ParB N-terminal domain-containing protein [Thermodesulfobacteriota bacterium]|nr:ParB N-terminal domain-containing protein [Thermodesulfobacteriota bacterium]
MKFEYVPLALVDFQNHSFFVGPERDIGSLEDSIKEVGLINPPVLRRTGDKYQIISGRRRLEACKELGFSRVFSKTYETHEISDEDCLKLVLYDNQERIGELEKAELLLKFRDICGLDEMELTKRVLPYLGIPPARRSIEKYVRLGKLEHEIKDGIYSQRITLEQALILSETAGANRMEIFRRVLLRMRLNTNETRDVVKEIQEVASRDKRGVGKIIDEIESKCGGGELKNAFRRELKLMRYPVLTQAEEEFRDCLMGLDLPKEVNVFHAPFFEGNHLEFRIRVESVEKLSRVLSYLSSALAKGEIDRLLTIVREGSPGKTA